MKTIGFILVTVILGLVFVPCADGITCADTEIERSQSQHADHEHDDETHDCGCSPFCFCDCCQVHFISYSFVQVTEVAKQDMKHRFQYLLPMGKVFQDVHFHPPRTSQS